MDTNSFYGGTIGELLSKWQDAGFFSYVLPFLLIFALLFGILSQMKLFKENRAINAIIALAVSLMALQFDMVPRFFEQVFPRVGIGIVVILIILIIMGLFMDPDQKGLMIGLMIFGGILVVIILYTTAGSLNWSGADWWRDHLGEIILVVIGVTAFILIVASGGKKDDKKQEKAWKAFIGRD